MSNHWEIRIFSEKELVNRRKCVEMEIPGIKGYLVKMKLNKGLVNKLWEARLRIGRGKDCEGPVQLTEDENERNISISIGLASRY